MLCEFCPCSYCESHKLPFVSVDGRLQCPHHNEDANGESTSAPPKSMPAVPAAAAASSKVETKSEPAVAAEAETPVKRRGRPPRSSEPKSAQTAAVPKVTPRANARGTRARVSLRRQLIDADKQDIVDNGTETNAAATETNAAAATEANDTAAAADQVVVEQTKPETNDVEQKADAAISNDPLEVKLDSAVTNGSVNEPDAPEEHVAIASSDVAEIREEKLEAGIGELKATEIKASLITIVHADAPEGANAVNGEGDTMTLETNGTNGTSAENGAKNGEALTADH